VLLLAFSGLVRVGVGVLLELVAVGDRPAGVPALAHRLLHPATALFEQIAHIPLGDALLDAAREDRGRVRDHRLVGGEQPDTVLLEFLLDSGGVGCHPREPVDALHDHSVEAALRGVAEQVVDAAVAWN
jgi:hypothetical protein